MSEPKVAPLVLELLLHFNSSGAPFPRIEAPVCRDAANWLLACQCTEESDLGYGSTYALTPKGRAWLDMILSTPLPVNRWLDPRSLPEEGRNAN